MLTNTIINQKIAEIENLQAKAAEIQELVDNLKAELKAELDERKVDSIDTGSHNVFYSVYEKLGVDTAKLKAAGLYDTYSKKSVITSFKITSKKVIVG